MSRSHRHLHGVPEPDPFTPEDGYSPEQLMTPACDEKGHTFQKRIAFRPTLFPVLGQIVASGQFGYRSPEDIVRDAVYHRIWYLADQLGVTYDHRAGKLEGEIRHVVTTAAQIADLERMAQQRSERVAYVEALQAELDECRHHRDQGGFILALSHAQARLDEPWLTDPYRSQVQAIVDKASREVW